MPYLKKVHHRKSIIESENIKEDHEKKGVIYVVYKLISTKKYLISPCLKKYIGIFNQRIFPYLFY